MFLDSAPYTDAHLQQANRLIQAAQANPTGDAASMIARALFLAEASTQGIDRKADLSTLQAGSVLISCTTLAHAIQQAHNQGLEDAAGHMEYIAGLCLQVRETDCTPEAKLNRVRAQEILALRR